ncbi:SHOCT domain-containing protein [Liquorilactobacillus mali]|uniref:SHOCT domain-containing protein n=1 Tax=Liquorilactobacillus mali TaxID=1618 RepID=UPI002650D03A|nr:SHOCT domain-containing protein [Liquorilactobacillus mali]MDN7145307.1 SHOCT domain-containing protein [Liquorilactobacillus mali]MDV7758224.1 hypothetical protein [Liquorilactobacillus mali]
MKIENKIIVRRLVAGILLMLLAVVIYSETNEISRISALSSSNEFNAVVGAGYILAIFAAIIGVFFSVTCKTRPKKWIEYSLSAFAIILMLLISLTDNLYLFKDLGLFRWGFIILVALGLPSKNGFKNMPFVSKKEAVTIDQPINNNDEIKSAPVKDTSSELRELKKLFEDDVITQEEFDAKKKQILKL